VLDQQAMANLGTAVSVDVFTDDVSVYPHRYRLAPGLLGGSGSDDG